MKKNKVAKVDSKIRHLQDLKLKRNRKCRSLKGWDHEYDTGVNLNNYKRLKEFYKNNPSKKVFSVNDCKKQVFPKKRTMNETKSHFTNIDSGWKCNKTGGVWDPTGLSRSNYKYNEGVCFATDSDKKCSKQECKPLMKWFHKTTSVKPSHGEIIKYRRACDKSNSCVFNKRSGECFLKKKVYDMHMNKMNRSARIIQTKARSFLERKRKSREMRKRTNAAKKIQSAVRKNQSRDILPSDWPKDLANTKTQNYLRNFYMHKKNRFPYPSDRVSKSQTKNRCVSNAPVKLSKTQSLLFSIAKGYSTGVTKNPRGLLCWHSTGSGKTCSAACIMHAFWNSPKRIVFCTSIEAKAANPPENFVKCMRSFFKSDVTLNAMTKRVSFFSFAQLAHYLQLYKPSGPEKNRAKRVALLDDAVLIIDEVQNLLKPIRGQEKEHNALRTFLKKKNNTPGLNVFVLSATPGDRVHEVDELLDIVDPNRTGVNGMIQYLDNSHDRSKFPSVTVHDHKLTLPSTMVPEYVQSSALKQSKMVGNKVQTIRHQLQTHTKQKHYIYSQYYRRQGVYGIIAVEQMLQSLGYEQATPSSLPNSKKKRYCIMTTTQLSSKTDALKLVNYFNQDKNVHGEYCQIMLASQKFNEGLDLKAVRHVHIMEPLSYAMEIQTIGRARRHCSHKQFSNMDEWTVKVHRYMNTLPTTSGTNVSIMSKSSLRGLSRDEKEFQRMEKEAKPLQTFLNTMKNASVDRKIII